MRINSFSILMIPVALSAGSEVVSKTVEHKQGDAVLEGAPVYDDTADSRGAACNERAGRRSWEATKQFFAEIFK